MLKNLSQKSRRGYQNETNQFTRLFIILTTDAWIGLTSRPNMNLIQNLKIGVLFACNSSAEPESSHAAAAEIEHADREENSKNGFVVSYIRVAFIRV